eukprot:jgi/Undpi1/12259/HiC_scaffold_5.g01935.m1
MASMRRFALMFSAATVSLLSNLSNFALRQVVVYEVGKTVYEGATYVHQGAGYVRSRVVPMLASYSSGHDFDVDNIPCLPGPMSDEEDDGVENGEEVDIIPSNDPCRVSFPTTENELSGTPATLGEGCKGAFPRKVDRSGVQIGKTLPRVVLGRDLRGKRHFERAASTVQVPPTSGGARNGMVDVQDARGGKALFDHPGDVDPSIQDDDSLFTEMCRLEAKDAPPWESGGDNVSTCWLTNITALPKEGAFRPIVGQHVERYAGGSAAASSRNDQALVPLAEPGPLVVWVSPTNVCTATTPVPRAEPEAMVLWTPSAEASFPSYDKIVAARWCCYRMISVPTLESHAGQRYPFDVILVTRHARRMFSAVASSPTLKATGESTPSVSGDTSVIAVETDSWWEPGLFTIEVTRTPCTVEHRPGLGEESTHPIGHTLQETLPQDPTVVWLEPELAGIGVARIMQHGISQYVRRMQVSFLMPEQGSTAADGAAGSDVRDIYDEGATGMTSTTTEHQFLGDRVVRSTRKGHRVKEAYSSDGVLTMPDISAVADALGPWMLAAGRGLTTYAWMYRYWAPTRKGKTGTAVWTGCWVLLCIFGTLPQVLDGLFAKETWLPAFLLWKVLAASAWFVILFLVNLAGSVVLALVNSTAMTWNMVWDVGLSVVTWTVVAASVFVLAAIASIWIVVVDELWLERKQQIPSTVTLSLAESTPAPTQPEASLSSSSTAVESVPVRHAVPVTETRAERKARRKAWLIERRVRGVGVHESAKRVRMPPKDEPLKDGGKGGGGEGESMEGRGKVFKERKKGGRWREGGRAEGIHNWRE